MFKSQAIRRIDRFLDDCDALSVAALQRKYSGLSAEAIAELKHPTTQRIRSDLRTAWDERKNTIA